MATTSLDRSHSTKVPIVAPSATNPTANSIHSPELRRGGAKSDWDGFPDEPSLSVEPLVVSGMKSG